jgi:uncharacterized protein YqgC (DUF456 family)
MEYTALLYVLSGLLIIAGLVGTVLPALPGVPLVFAGMLLAAWTDGFHTIGGFTIAVLALLTLLALVADFAAGMLGAKRVGASKLALLGAALGTLFGVFLGLPGLVVGPFAGALIGEWLHGRNLAHASKVGIGTWLGMVFGALLKLVVSFVMLGVFAFAWLVG